MRTLPRLIVFDLDFTLWDCGGTWCDCLTPPFRRSETRLLDRGDRHIRLYDDVHAILDRCDEHNLPMALASRTERPPWARELVEMLGIASRFRHAEIYPSSKRKHFDALIRESGVAFDQMLFFDDEMRNIREVGSLGVTSVFVEDGMSRELFEEGLSRFAA
ncbi:magnesium-dependent phosphatase-1 [Rhodopirellula sp. JC740]|uniref:Magnesium-dependent phosphatase-1 n=1 Tax=Rhodopirellula halodulae TaxID=2894198 RepID=A0ABS8NK53_9BACT|nr:magnesium-dependent phosphatase-1 [Rhodopirellula sp. JC740]MCC9642866.1 magnesium-dependent phosphatase-1 [Rhodopirellula sp. JC740]